MNTNKDLQVSFLIMDLDRYDLILKEMYLKRKADNKKIANYILKKKRILKKIKEIENKKGELR